MEKKVLLVEDSQADAVLVREAFKRVEMVCVLEHVKNGEQALATLREAPLPALILLDLSLPGLDGHQLLQEIKENASMKSCPVLVLSTSDHKEDIDRCYRQGANSYIVKPSNLSQMVEIFSHVKEFWLETASLPSQL